jgi:hypothetical protein
MTECRFSVANKRQLCGKTCFFKASSQEKAWICRKSGLGSLASTGRHPQNFMIRNRIAGLWVTSRQIAGFFGSGAGLWIFGANSGISGVRRRSNQGTGRPVPLAWFNAGERMLNIEIRVND